jgi:hypothetical protein
MKTAWDGISVGIRWNLKLFKKIFIETEEFWGRIPTFAANALFGAKPLLPATSVEYLWGALAPLIPELVALDTTDKDDADDAA